MDSDDGLQGDFGWIWGSLGSLFEALGSLGESFGMLFGVMMQGCSLYSVLEVILRGF